MAERIPARLSPAEGRKFGLTVGIAFMVLAGLVWWRAQHALSAIFLAPVVWGGRHTLSAVFAVLGALLVLAGLALPTELGPLQRAWMGLAHAISKVTTPIFMGIVYFLVIGPIGIVMRLFGKNPLVARQSGGSVWAARGQRKGDMQRQF